MLKSSNDGASWTQFVPAGAAQDLNVNLLGVAFKDTSTGVFVGHASDAPGPRAVAYQYLRSGLLVTWSIISPSFAASVDSTLTDVVIYGNTAYAVGEKTVADIRMGVIVKSDWSAGTGFGTFTALSDPGFAMCRTHDPHSDLATTPIVLEIETDNSNGDIWIGGQCGRIWRRTSAGVWTTFGQTQTSTHIEGISIPSSTTGYFGGLRMEEIAHCLVRYHP